MFPRSQSSWWAGGSIGLVVVALGALTVRHERVREQLVAAYRADEHARTQDAVIEVQAVLKPIYEGLRTVSRLPSVRRALAGGAALSDDDQITVQELYNNLANAVDMSEVYLVPADIDPDGLVGGPSEPLVSYDELIVGRTATPDERDEVEVPEIEIYEYRLMRQQFAWLKDRAPRPPEGLDEVLATGPEVITCDNSHYDPRNPVDRARSGLVLTVPVYGPDDRLVGGVSGILRTDVLRQRLIGDTLVLRDGANDLTLTEIGRDPSPWARLIAEGRPDESVLYSEVIPIRFAPGVDDWKLWIREPDSGFDARPDVQFEDRFFGASATLLLVGIGMTALWLYAMQRALDQARGHEATARLALRERSAEVERRLTAEGHLRAALQAANAATAAKSQFLTNMSHELRTPMNAILGYAELLTEETGADDHATRADLARILGAGRHLLALINDVLDLSKIEAGRMQLAPEWVEGSRLVVEIVATATPLMATNRNRFEVVVDPDLGLVRVDALRMKQVVLNLLSNAAKFTSDGVVTLTVSRIDHPAPGVRWTVADTGIGISEAQLGQLFRPFVQGDASTSRNFGGTGLGLALSARMAALMDGSVEARSAPGVGSVFTFSFPLPQEGRPAPSAGRATPADAPRT